MGGFPVSGRSSSLKETIIKGDVSRVEKVRRVFIGPFSTNGADDVLSPCKKLVSFLEMDEHPY